MPERLQRILFASAMVGVIATAGRADSSGRRPPHIILCMADDQGWGDVGYNGHAVLKTPHLDQMAAQGLRFDRFYAAAPVCSPTRGSVMTGRHPNRFGCFTWGHPIRPQEITIAEALREAGYVTGHFGKWHLGSVQKGSPVHPGASGFDEWLSAPNFFDLDPILSREGKAVPLKGDSSIVTAEAARDFIREHAQGERPFLAVVWFGSPHNPYQALDEDRRPYADHPEPFAHYYGEITGMDRAVGMLRAELRRLNIHENTIFWYCSDNGGVRRFGETGGRGHKGTLYEGGLRVPGILEWPARVRPARTAVPATTSDIFPTLLEIAGARPDPRRPLDGISLTGLIDGRMTQRPEAIGFWNRPIAGIRTPSASWMAELLAAQKEGREITDPLRLRRDAGEIREQHPSDAFPGQSAWLDWPWKLHRIEHGEEAVRCELYDLANDPMEQTDLAQRETQRVRTLRAAQERWLASVVRSLNGGDYQ